MLICVLYWYHFYLNHPGVSRLYVTILGLCYWKGLVMQAKMYAQQ